MPLKPDLSFSRLDEFMNEPIVSEPTVKKPKVKTSKVKASADKPKVVRKNNVAPIIKEWVSDSEDEAESKPKNEKKNVEPSFSKIEFVKSKEQAKSPRKTIVKQGLVSLTTARQVNTTQSKTIVNSARPMTNVFDKAHSIVRRPINNKIATKNSNFNQRVNTVKAKNVNTAKPKVAVNAAKPKVVLDAVKGNQVNAVKASACLVSKPKTKVINHVSKHNSASMLFKRFYYVDAQGRSNGCSRHMKGNMSYLTDFEEIDEGYVAFGGSPKGGKITSRGTIKTENQIDQKVKVIRCDNGTEFKNKEMSQFCERKGIKREFSVARTPQQNGVATRKNRTLIEAAKTMLAESMLPITFWAEAVNTACYVQNRVLVTKPHNKTPYELFLGRKPTLGFMKPFRCPVTILNTIDHLGKFDGKADEGLFVGYSVNSKAFRVFGMDIKEMDKIKEKMDKSGHENEKA
ncbi:ribonuclease H-like domain-containing protein [Tanacetum coccineum]